MKSFEEILIKKPAETDCVFPCTYWQNTAIQIVELECYKALKKIKAILEDARLKD